MGRILLIDGDPSERLIIRSRLQELGHEVLAAESGAKGLVEARTGAADLVLLSTDLGGGVDAAEVCRRLKATPGLNRIPVLVYSATAVSSEVADRMYDGGCEAFLGRVQLPHLDRILEVHLRVKSQGDELSNQNRVLELENRRLEEERQRTHDLDASMDPEDAQGLVFRELAAGRPDGVLLVDGEGVIRECDRGGLELLGGRLVGTSLGKVAPGCGLEAFVRDARTSPREGFRFEISARRDRNPRSLMASVMPVTAGDEGQPLRVLLLLDIGKRRVAEELARASEPGIPRQQLGALIEAARMTYVPEAVTGGSSHVIDLRRALARLAPSSAPVLVRGERGSGKELAGRVLHYSSRRTGSFLQLRCSAMGAKTLTTELFGAQKITKGGKGAKTERPGLLALAQDGTIFLGEIADLPLELQERLFEAMQSGSLEGPGLKGKERVDFRLVASSSRDLDELVQRGEFHAGLADLLRGQRVTLTPLRERRTDVAVLAQVFLDRFGPAFAVDTLSEEARWVMEQYDWPGNVAELEDCVEQACARAAGSLIEVSHLTRPLRDFAASLPSTEVVPARRVVEGPEEQAPVPGTHLVSHPMRVVKPWMITDEDPISLDLYEKKVLLRALDSTGGDKLAAARLLEVGKSTLYRKLKKFGIS